MEFLGSSKTPGSMDRLFFERFKTLRNKKTVLEALKKKVKSFPELRKQPMLPLLILLENRPIFSSFEY